MLLTTVNAALQRVPRARPDRHAVAVGRARQHAGDGRRHPLARAQRLSSAPRPCASRATMRCAAASSTSFRPAWAMPVRLDFFGDTLESIRSFDPETQRTTDTVARARPRAGRRIPAHHRDDPPLPHRLCGGVRRRAPDDPLYEAVERRPPPSRHGALAAAVPRQARDAVRLSAGRAGRARAAGRGRGARAPRPDRRLLRGAPARRSRPTAPARPTSRCRRTALSRRSRMARAARGAARSRGSRRSPMPEARRASSMPARGRAQLRGRARRSRAPTSSTR